MFKVIVMPKTLEVWLPPGSSLTELEYEIPKDCMPFGCKAGACGTCVIEVLDGLNNLGEKGGDESDFLETLGYPEEKFRLACKCRLNGAITFRVAQ